MTCCCCTTRRSSCWRSRCPAHARRTVVWAEWGQVPFPLRTGIPAAPLPGRREAGPPGDGCLAGHARIGPGGRRATRPSWWSSPMCCAPRRSATPSRDARGYAASSGIPADAFVVGCISRFHPKKRNDVVVERRARARGSTVHLILAGDGETEARAARAGGAAGRARALHRHAGLPRCPRCFRPSTSRCSARAPPRARRGR